MLGTLCLWTVIITICGFLCWALLQESDYSFTSHKDNPEARPPPPFPPDVPSSDSEDVMYILNVV